jgi:hypothetical protein
MVWRERRRRITLPIPSTTVAIWFVVVLLNFNLLERRRKNGSAAQGVFSSTNNACLMSRVVERRRQ